MMHGGKEIERGMMTLFFHLSAFSSGEGKLACCFERA